MSELGVLTVGQQLEVWTAHACAVIEDVASLPKPTAEGRAAANERSQRRALTALLGSSTTEGGQPPLRARRHVGVGPSVAPRACWRWNPPSPCCGRAVLLPHGRLKRVEQRARKRDRPERRVRLRLDEEVVDERAALRPPPRDFERKGASEPPLQHALGDALDSENDEQRRVGRELPPPSRRRRAEERCERAPLEPLVRRRAARSGRAARQRGR